MNAKLIHAAALGCILSATNGASAVHTADVQSANQQGAAERIDIDAALTAARFVGMGDQRELIVPMPMNDGARQLGAKSMDRIYKGICGPEGALATPELLLEHARRDLERMNTPARGSATIIFGESPRFVITYDPADAFIIAFGLPNFQAACEYVDDRLDSRTEIRINLTSDDIPGNVIGSAGSSRQTFSYNTYVNGLDAAAGRFPENSAFVDAMPTPTLPVRYDLSPTTTNEADVVANDTQIRAIFGENSFAQANAISITLDNTADWDPFVYIDDQVNSGELSLVDVVVHEITHGLGFRSTIAQGGNNSSNDMAGLDVARFRNSTSAPIGTVGGTPITATQFTTFPRWGDNLINFESSIYARPVNTGFDLAEFIELEGGDNGQPSHLARKSDFDDKLGLMDPVINSGTTYGPEYWSSNDARPLDDMGWKLITTTDIIGDCNGNGVLDIVDIASGFRDADGDLRLDICETFLAPTSPAGSYVDRITETVYDAGGITSLLDFFPGSATVIDRFLEDDVDKFYSSSDADTVRVFSGFIEATAPDEYAFRIEHDDDVILEIGGELFFRPGLGDLEGGTVSDASVPMYVQLEQGFHEFEMTVLIRGSDSIQLRREARSLGGWGPVPSEDLGGTFFEDCNENGRDDQFDPDSDGDGIPDDCEEPDCDGDNIPDSQELDCDGNGIPDDCEPRGDFVNVFDAGIAGTDQDIIEYGTCNSPDGFQFDTEMAIWDSNGDLVATNDDTLEPCNTNRLSRLDLQLPAGDYFIGITGYDMLFSDNFGVEPGPGTTCSEGGAYFLTIGDVATVIADVDSGKVKVFKFQIEEAPTCRVDFASPFGTLNFFDISAYISAYNAGDLAADFASPFGTLNFFDISAFISEYNAGCP
ncbi:MAG: NF038122 family metalloprotease [Phycisphaerales bacterium]